LAEECDEVGSSKRETMKHTSSISKAPWDRRTPKCFGGFLNRGSTLPPAHAYLPGVRSFSLMLLVACTLVGCRERRAVAPTTGTYGPAPAQGTQAVARARPHRSTVQPWTNGVLSVIQTELSPATLYHARTNTLSLFSGMPETGLGAPTFVAIPTPVGPKIFKQDATIDASRLNESWMVVWFAGAHGWTNWDSPWLITLQRKPTKISLGTNGLSFTFSGEAGYAALMPIYGYYKPAHPVQAALPVFQGKEKKKRVLTWEWEKALPADPLARARYWASALKEFPIYCEDSFSVDRSSDAVVLRQRIEFLSWNDDWNTKHLKLAPISPVLAHAFKEGFPAEFSKKPFDMEMFTSYGPVMGIEGVESYDVTLPVLRYINEMEAFTAPKTNVHPSVAAALQRLRAVAGEKFRDPARYEYDHGGLNNFCWAIQGERWYAKALPYLDEPLRGSAIQSLKKYFREDVLVTNRFKLREFPEGSGRTYYILEGPGIGSWGVLGDAGKFSANMLETLWAYAHFTGDWDFIRERWELIRKLFVTPAESRWVGFGRDAIAELGDEAAPCLAMARLAYKAGDMATYDYAAMMFARELAHHWVKQRGAPYFREHQPWHSMEALDDEVFLTNLWGDLAGWQIDGPKYPQKTGERQFNNRWVRFGNEDVARFYRGYFAPDIRRELDTLRARWPEERRWKNDSHIMPSLVQLRSLLLNESPSQLASNATPDRFTGPASGVIASCISVLRTSHPTTYERLIPGGPASPFVAGIERDVPGPHIHLAQSVVMSSSRKDSKETIAQWPRSTWWGWQTPTGARWNFGQVIAGTNTPAKAETTALNWNTAVTVLD
jgi:hypothetical protein